MRDDRHKRNQAEGALDAALGQWRSALHAAPEQLTDAARDQLRERLRSTRDSRVSPLAALFPTVPRFSLAAGLIPVLAVTLMMAGLTVRLQSKAVPGPLGHGSVEVIKTADEVVFSISNGDRAHNIYKSNDVNRMGEDIPYATTVGTFRDRLDSGSGLVFYRID